MPRSIRACVWGEAMGARWLRNPSLMIGALISLAIVLCAIFAPAIATHGVEQMDMRNRFAGPSLQHWLGTDNFGRDLWSRLVFGARVSLAIALLSVSAAAVVCWKNSNAECRRRCQMPRNSR